MNAAEIKARMLASFTKYPTAHFSIVEDVLDAYSVVCAEILAVQKPVATPEAVEAFLKERCMPLYPGWVAEILAAIRRFVPPQPARTAVRSVGEIANKMAQREWEKDPNFDRNRVMSDAIVAHDLMLELAPREKMKADGWTVERWADAIHVAFPEYAEHVHNRLAAVVHRLANTPAEPKPDPDAKAKNLYIRFLMAKNNLAYENCKWDWDNLNDRDRNGWRAVAAARREG